MLGEMLCWMLKFLQSFCILKEGKELDDGLNKLEEQKRVRESEREKWKEELARQSKE